MLNFFKFLRSSLQFMKIVFVFCIIMLSFYWVMNILGANWVWLGFITPFLDILLVLSDKIYSASFDLFGATFELKYFSGVVILIIFSISMNWIIELVNTLERAYINTRLFCKKTEENILNKNLQNTITTEQKKINRYVVTINTTLKAKFAHKELNIDIDEQNKLMNKFIMEKTLVVPTVKGDSFVYKFICFDDIDNVLDVLFKVMKSKAPLNYAICIQIDSQDKIEDAKQLEKLVSLKNYGKITMAADTSYRYKFNKSHRYGTSQIGIFQNGDKTLELHEFKEIL